MDVRRWRYDGVLATRSYHRASLLDFGPPSGCVVREVTATNRQLTTDLFLKHSTLTSVRTNASISLPSEMMVGEFHESVPVFGRDFVLTGPDAVADSAFDQVAESRIGHCGGGQAVGAEHAVDRARKDRHSVVGWRGTGGTRAGCSRRVVGNSEDRIRPLFQRWKADSVGVPGRVAPEITPWSTRRSGSVAVLGENAQGDPGSFRPGAPGNPTASWRSRPQGRKGRSHSGRGS